MLYFSVGAATSLLQTSWTQDIPVQRMIGVFKEVKGLWDIVNGKWAAELAFTFY